MSKIEILPDVDFWRHKEGVDQEIIELRDKINYHTEMLMMGVYVVLVIYIFISFTFIFLLL